MDENNLSFEIIGAAIEVHWELGPGLLESVYEFALAHELGRRGFAVERQKLLALRYKGEALDCGFRIDMLVDGLVIVEIKAVEAISRLHEMQLLTYLRLAGLKLGLLLNFNAVTIKDGTRRVVNNL